MPLWLILVGGAVVLLLLKKKGAGGPGAPGLDGGQVAASSAGTHATIDALFARQLRDLPAIREHYNLSRLKRITRAAANAFGIPPEWVWGVMWRESRWTPIGVYAHSAAKAKAVGGGQGSTAYGMGQMLGRRFGNERDWAEANYPGVITWSHQDLIDPQRTIWTVASSYRRALEKHGRSKLESQGGKLLGQWWAGFSGEGWKRKAGDISAKGPNVHSDTTPTGWTATPTGPTSSADDEPPSGAPAGVSGSVASAAVDASEASFWEDVLGGA